jgi:UDP-glucose 4-epimerase
MILVTWGAGYIGSVTAELLLARGEGVVILDNLDRGHRDAVPERASFYEGNIGDRKLLARIAQEHKLEACIHFAALAYVGESVLEPARYFSNNVEQGIALLDELLKAGVRRLVFSSTCATYGEPETIPISEDHPQHPTKSLRLVQVDDGTHSRKLRSSAWPALRGTALLQRIGGDQRTW